MKFTPKYTTVRGEGGVLEFFLSYRLILLVIQEVMRNFKIVGFQNRGFNPSRVFMKFTPKYTTVRGEGGVLEFQNCSFTPSRLFLVSD